MRMIHNLSFYFEIKKEERRLFEKEMGGMKLPDMYDSLSVEDSSWQRHRGLQYAKIGQQPTQSLQRSAAAPLIPTIETTTTRVSSSHNQQQSPRFQNSSMENWCFFCASPWSSVSVEMQRVIRNLLELRRSHYPTDAVNRGCTSPKDLDMLARQKCLYRYCQTLVLTDHNSGNFINTFGINTILHISCL